MTTEKAIRVGVGLCKKTTLKVVYACVLIKHNKSRSEILPDLRATFVKTVLQHLGFYSICPK